MSDDKNILHTKDNKYHACVVNNNDTIRLYLNKLFKTNTQFNLPTQNRFSPLGN